MLVLVLVHLQDGPVATVADGWPSESSAEAWVVLRDNKKAVKWSWESI